MRIIKLCLKDIFYRTLIERGWLESTYGLPSKTGPISKYVHFIYKTYSNANDFGVIAKYRSNKVELTRRGTTHDFLTLDKIAKKFSEGGDAFVRQILGIKNYKSRATILNQDTPLRAENLMLRDKA